MSSAVNKGFGLLFEMGCGKTLTAIAIIGVGYQLGRVRRVLIVAPSSVCAVWPREFQDYADFPYDIRTLLGDKRQRLRELEKLRQTPANRLQAAVINYEAVWREEIFAALTNYDPDLIICDESQRIKTHNSRQSKALHQLGDRARYKLILSGTPVQNQAVDIYSQYRFLDSSVFGKNFYAFRSRYAVMGGFNNKQILGYRYLEELVQKEHAIACRVTKAEALDLPEQTFINRYIPLNPQERRLYEQLRRESRAELADGGTVTTATVLTKLLRLQQFTGGFLPGEDVARCQQVGSGKLAALTDIFQDYVVEGGKKLVIFARFLPEVRAIEKLAAQLLAPHDLCAVTICGQVPKEERGAIVERFQTDPRTVVFIGQIDTAGTGITLTAADTCVYYSLTFNYAAYSQSLSRIHRIGQRRPCTYIHLLAENTIDSDVLAALEQKQDLAKIVVDDWKKFFSGG